MPPHRKPNPALFETQKSSSDITVILGAHLNNAAVPALTYSINGARYQFNIPDAFSRASGTGYVSTRDTKAVFLGDTSRSVLGFPGFILNNEARGASSLAVAGPGHFLTHYAIASFRTLLRRPRMALSILEPEPSSSWYSRPPIYHDKNISVWSFGSLDLKSPSLKRPRTVHTTWSSHFSSHSDAYKAVVADMFPGFADLSASDEMDNVDVPGRLKLHGDVPPCRVRDPLPPPFSSDDVPDITSHSNSYYIVTNMRRGIFDVSRARSLGIPPGPAFSALSQGKSLFLSDLSVSDPSLSSSTFFPSKNKDARAVSDSLLPGPGRWISPTDVLSEPSKGNAFLVINLNTPSHLAVLDLVDPTLLDNSECASLDAVFLLSSSKNILTSDHVSSWVSSLPSHTQVFCVSPDFSQCTSYPFQDGLRRVRDLAQINTAYAPSQTEVAHDVAPAPPSFPATPLSVYSTVSLSHNGVSSVALLPTSSETATAKTATAKTATAETNGYSHAQNLPASSIQVDTPAVTVLGSSSAVPGKYRSLSSYLIHLHEGYSLFDCGEGALGQLSARFGPHADSIISGIRFIFISHKHLDHCSGLSSFLMYRARITSAPLALVTPSQVLLHLSERHALPDGIVATPLQSVNSFEPYSLPSLGGPDAHDGLELSFTQVDHSCLAWAVALQLPPASGYPKFKLTYSGDTRFCPALAKLAHQSSLLIHEATFEAPDTQMAHAKGHSTDKQAVQICAQSHSERLLFTHFSARIRKVPAILLGPSSESFPMAMAFDFVSYPITSFAHFAKGYDEVDLVIDDENDPAAA